MYIKPFYLRHAKFPSQNLDGIHKSVDPVSKITLKCCGGVPIEMFP